MVSKAFVLVSIEKVVGCHLKAALGHSQQMQMEELWVLQLEQWWVQDS